jgi:hypothetical protein
MKNGKGLAAIVLSSALVAGALSFGCQKGDYQKREKNVLNLNNISSQNKGQSGLEQYFFQNEELKSAKAYLGKVRWGDNEFESFKISKGDALKEAGFGDEVNNLEQAGRAVYSLPNGTKVLLTVKEYKSEDLATQVEISKNYGQVTSSPFMIQKGKFLISTENIDEILYNGIGAIDSRDKKEFAKIWKDYINRTGGEPNITIGSEGELNYTGLNKDLASKVEDAEFAQAVKEYESLNPASVRDIIKDFEKDGQEDFFDYLTPEENEKPKLQSTTPKEESCISEPKTIHVGLSVLTDIFNAEIVFYEREGENIEGKDAYTHDWKVYADKLVNDRGYETIEGCFVTLKDKNSFVELKAIVNNPNYYPFETDSYKYGWGRDVEDKTVPLVALSMYENKK